MLVTSYDWARSIFKVDEIIPAGAGVQYRFRVYLEHRRCDCGYFHALHYPFAHALAACANARIDWTHYVDGVHWMGRRTWRVVHSPRGYGIRWIRLSPGPEDDVGHGEIWGSQQNDPFYTLLYLSNNQCMRLGEQLAGFIVEFRGQLTNDEMEQLTTGTGNMVADTSESTSPLLPAKWRPDPPRCNLQQIRCT
ncbi:hypothetical protein PIB30_082756 [Stylosanthes scabra]|uniref:Zinc finger PMZ-type domain-containing protein n=1 Tax=Stylosanthes scabra TaxID=79078 RepID=A0ABU6TUA6_9FABA|nr:hypothetical protein [Stylosanthes scabra]